MNRPAATGSSIITLISCRSCLNVQKVGLHTQKKRTYLNQATEHHNPQRKQIWTRWILQYSLCTLRSSIEIICRTQMLASLETHVSKFLMWCFQIHRELHWEVPVSLELLFRFPPIRLQTAPKSYQTRSRRLWYLEFFKSHK